ncbi:hypothetical protein GCM10027091_18180 [Streptomyces daliensis]
MNLATAGVATHDAGVASAMVNTSQQVGGSIGTALLNTLAVTTATNYLVDKQPTAQVQAEAAIESYSTAYWWSALFFAIGCLLTLLLYRPGPPEPSEGGGAVRM